VLGFVTEARRILKRRNNAPYSTVCALFRSVSSLLCKTALILFLVLILPLLLVLGMGPGKGQYPFPRPIDVEAFCIVIAQIFPGRHPSAIWRPGDRCESSINFELADKVCLFSMTSPKGC
jgi:hypothetical protein